MSFEKAALNKRNGETEDSHEVNIVFHRCYFFFTTLNYCLPPFLRSSCSITFFCVIEVNFTTDGEESGEIVNLAGHRLVEVDELGEVGIAASAGW